MKHITVIIIMCMIASSCYSRPTDDKISNTMQRIMVEVHIIDTDGKPIQGAVVADGPFEFVDGSFEVDEKGVATVPVFITDGKNMMYIAVPSKK